MPNPKRLRTEDYEQIEAKVNLTGTEDFVVVSQQRHNKVNFSVHVFARQPMTKELTKYEETSSRMKLKGTRAELEGSPLLAARDLYNVLIARAYDVRVGRKLVEELSADEAKELVPQLVKRAAIREFLGGVEGASEAAEDEGDIQRADEGD